MKMFTIRITTKRFVVEIRIDAAMFSVLIQIIVLVGVHLSNTALVA